MFKTNESRTISNKISAGLWTSLYPTTAPTLKCLISSTPRNHPQRDCVQMLPCSPLFPLYHWKRWKCGMKCHEVRKGQAFRHVFYVETYHTYTSSQQVSQNLCCYSTMDTAVTKPIASGSPLSSTGPKMARLSLTVVQFHLLPRNWCWHSWIPIFTPSATLGMIST